MKTRTFSAIMLAALMSFSMTSCELLTETEEQDTAEYLAGQAGNPRFNLTFDNQRNADLDLYVEDPQGSVIYYGRTYSPSGGRLDVDCECSSCPQGPSENIFWPLDNSAPKGTYTFWVEYYEACSSTAGAESNFQVYVTNGSNSKIVAKRSGKLSPTNVKSTVWTYDHR